MEFTNLDIIVVAVYFLLLIVIGYLAARKQNEEKFLISERKLGVWSGIATINATKTGSILMTFTAVIYLFGFSAIWLFFGAGIGYLIFIPFSKKIHLDSNERFYTLADYFSQRYGKRTALFASLLSAFYAIGLLAINLIAATKIFAFFSGISYGTSAIIISTTILIYLLFAGFNAVVKTDVLQYLAITSILLLFLILLIHGIEIPKKEFTLFSAGAKNIFGFLLTGILIPFFSPDLWQRVYAFKRKKDLKKSILCSVAIYVIFGIVLAFLALSIKTALPNLEPDIALVEGLAHLLPPGFAGLAVIMLLGAMMSSIDTYAYTGASVVIQDFLKKISKQETVLKIRWATFIIIFLTTALILVFRDLLWVTFIVFAVSMILGILAIATWIKPSIKKKTLNWAFSVAIVLAIVFISKDLSAQNLTPVIMIKTILGTIIGLLIGSFVSSGNNKS